MTSQGFEQAFQKVGQLAKEFQANVGHYLVSKSYAEAEVRKDFIDKFFIALGWDVNHEVQTNPFEQEVKVERAVAMGAARRRADYVFHASPNFRDARLIVEAKKPSGEIATPDNYFQTIRYGWSKNNPIAGLTNFAQLHLLDCRYKPDIETAIHSCLKKYSLEDYFDREKFAEIYWLISREAVVGGSLEKYAATLSRPRGRAKQRRLFGRYLSIDESFLEDLDEYRNVLARAFKNRNPELDSETLTEVTQRTLDRLVFMRFLEDKLIEPSHFVANFGKRGTAWRDFIEVSRRLDGTYNGIVFKKHEILDATGFPVDDDAFAGICEELSHQNSPYDFNSIPIHILGSIYERFLGNIIVATDKRVRVEQKPEVRKAGGVYYTPDYIVRYIVENTVGKLIEGKSPEQIAEMKFADIACGSGSFLLGVYDLLLRYHAKYYNDHPRKARKNDYITKDGVFHLSLEKKREILLNNIYGVDIDPQAVEVTQLSLYLKLLDEETIASTRGYQHRIHAAILPPLNENIVCGNSLVGMDILEGRLFASDEERKLNPIDFDNVFPNIMKAGGFDAIVGNPPWGAELSEAASSYLVERYPQVPTKTKDTYFYFIARAVSKLCEAGFLGLIVPNTWLLINTAKSFRQDLLSFDITEIIDHGDGIFRQATVESATLILANQKDGEKKCRAVRVRKGVTIIDHIVDKTNWLADEYCRIIVDADESIAGLLRKLKSRSEPFGKRCTIKWGIKPYQVGYGIPRQTREMVEQRVYHATKPKGKDWKPLLVGSDINRYVIQFPGDQYIKYGKWLMYASSAELMAHPKLLLRQTSDILRACYDEMGYYCQNSVFIVHSKEIDLKFLLALLNSKLLGFVYQLRNPQAGKVFAEIKPSVIKGLPIRAVSISNNADKSRHDQIVRLVDAMLDAKKRLSVSKTDKDKNYYENKCAALDRQIDTLVYELYGLTTAEIRIVEGS